MASDDTRERILKQGALLLRRDGIAAVRVADVAMAAGVSRQAVYLHFTSRAGLLTEIARHLDVTCPHGKRVREALTIEPAEVALEQFVRAYFRYLPPALEVLTALDAAAITDEAARAAWQSRKQVMHDMLSVIIRRLADSGRLQSSWSVARAADWGLVMLHPATWAELVGARGWSARSVTEHVVDALKRELLA